MKSIQQLLVCVAFLAGGGIAQGQGRGNVPRLDAESVQAQTRLEAVRARMLPTTDPLAVAGLVGRFPALEVLFAHLPAVQTYDVEKTVDAVAELRQLVEDLGDGLVPLPPSPFSTMPPPLLSVRRQAAQLVAQWPRSVRVKYYQAAEKHSAEVLKRGLADRSEALLQRVVREAAGTASAARAVEALGDIAFFKGHLHEALSWWSRLAPLPTRAADGETTAYADAAFDRPGLHARQVLALAYLGNLPEAKKQRDAFAHMYPKATGSFAGIKGSYVETLDGLLRRFGESGDITLQTDWPTLGGNAERQAVNPRCPSSTLWIDGPSWRIPLPERAQPPKQDGVVLASARPLHHPLIVGDRILLADDQSLTAYHLATGKQIFRQTFPEAMNPSASAQMPAFTASADRDLAVLRLGQPPDLATHLAKPAERTWLAGVELGDVEKDKRVRWLVSVPVDKPADASFTSPPLFHRGRVWVAFQEWKGANLLQGVASLNPETGRWLSNTTLGKEPLPPPGRDAPRQPVLLSGAGSLIIVCMQAGAVAALDAHTGSPVWAIRYPTQGPYTRLVTLSARELCAPLFALDRVFVAPQDTDLLLCIDPHTGAIVWEREILDIVQLLGCSQGKLIFTTSDGLRSVAAETGMDRDGWLAPPSGALAPHGRGLILGEWVFWPTKNPTLPMRVLSVERGLPELDRELSAWNRPRPLFFGPTTLHRLPAGNLAFGQDSLVIATEKELVGFVSPRRLLDARKTDADKKPTPIAHFLLALSEADAGMREAAVQRLRGPILTGPTEWRDLALDRLHDLLAEKTPEAARTDEEVWLTDNSPTAASPFRARPDPASVIWKTAKTSFPFRRAFHLTDARLLPLHRTAATTEANVLFVQNSASVLCLDALSGKPHWSVSWTGAADWVGIDKGKAFIAGPNVVQCLALKDGAIRWTKRNPRRLQDRYVLDGILPRFLKAVDDLHDFALGEEAIFCRLGPDLQLTIDIDTGQVRQRYDRADDIRGVGSKVAMAVSVRLETWKDAITAFQKDSGTTLWELRLPVSAQEWSHFQQGNLLILHPSGKERVCPAALRFSSALALAWQQKNPIAVDDAEFFLIDPVRGKVQQRISLGRGPGPFRAQPFPGGLAVTNGRETAGFVFDP